MRVSTPALPRQSLHQYRLLHHHQQYCFTKVISTSHVLHTQVESVPRSSRSSGSTSNAASNNEIKLYYRTSWPEARVHGSLAGGPWSDFILRKVPSAPGKWLTTTIVSKSNGAVHNGAASAPLLEFVITNQHDQWDKPPTGDNYHIQAAGRYKLQSGEVTAVDGRAVMVFSDLDGTMVGDDAATAAFKAFWEDVAVVRGSLLAYNTGRSLDSFLQLMGSKQGVLAHPDALISAVGTKVYEFDGKRWQEDQSYSKLLDQGWSLNTVRDACYKTLAKVGKDCMHFRPPEEQNQHKVTCGVHTSVVGLVMADIQAVLEEAQVQSNIITSGHGDWRFLDVVPIKAGKLEALNYVRLKHGFAIEDTIACGDSGNDILMLAGKNPAIVVGNAQPDLKQWVSERLKVEAPAGGADGKQRLLVASHHEALGILEGLEYFGFK